MQGDLFRLVDNLMRMAQTHRRNHDEGRAVLLEALNILHGADIWGGIAAVLQMMAPLESADGRHERAMRLYGAAVAITDSIGGGSLAPLSEDPIDDTRGSHRGRGHRSGPGRGPAMTRDEAVAYARKPDA